MKKLIQFFTLLNCFSINAQILQFGEDISLCFGQEVQIVAPEINIDSSMFIYFDSPDTIDFSNQDDVFSDTLDIGFDFTFYDSTYSQFVLGQNGALSFDLSKALQTHNWELYSPIPNDFNTKNAILFPFIDLRPGALFVTETIGVSPNRKLVVQIQNAEAFGDCGYVSSSVILNEGTNTIELHIGNKSMCYSWNGGFSTHGLHSRIDTIAHTVPGRNGELWSTFQDGKKFTPNGPFDYTISDIPYQVAVDSFEIVWGEYEANSFPQYQNEYTFSDTLTVMIDESWNDMRSYYIAIKTISFDTVFNYQPLFSDSSTINFQYTPQNTAAENDFCNSGIGKAIVTTYNTSDSSFYWPQFDVYDDTLENLLPGTYEFIFTEENGCQTPHQVVVENDSNFTIFSSSVNCPNYNYGYIEVSPDITGSTNFEWLDFPDIDTSYVNSLDTGQYVCIATSLNGCIDTLIATIESNNEIYIDSLMVTNTTCEGGSDGLISFNAISTYSAYNVYFNNEISYNHEFENLSAGQYPVHINAFNGCQYFDTIVISGPNNPLSASGEVFIESGKTEGSVVIYTEGGLEPYEYTIDDLTQTSNEFDNLPLGEYECIVTDANGCTDTVTFVINQELSLNENSGINPMIFPNPANDFITVKLDGTFNLKLMNIQGKVVFASNNVAHRIDFPIGSIAEGVYTLIVESNGERSFSRVVVKH